jgi:hypothetical protein
MLFFVLPLLLPTERLECCLLVFGYKIRNLSILRLASNFQTNSLGLLSVQPIKRRASMNSSSQLYHPGASLCLRRPRVP